VRRTKGGTIHRVKYWEIIADKLSKAGWSLGWVSAIDSEGRTLWIVDAHRDNGKRFVVTNAGLRLDRVVLLGRTLLRSLADTQALRANRCLVSAKKTVKLNHAVLRKGAKLDIR
jgi:hypothetical protein